METTINENGQAIGADARFRKIDAGDAASGSRGGASEEVHNLMADMQDLLGRISHVADPEIIRLRAKVERALATAKRTLADGADRVQRHAKDAMTAGDSYVRDQPWQAVGIAAAAGLVVGFIVARR